jgi:hypothetical protein
MPILTPNNCGAADVLKSLMRWQYLLAAAELNSKLFQLFSKMRSPTLKALAIERYSEKS